MDAFVIELSGRLFGLPVEDVRDVARLSSLRPLADAPECADGTTQVRDGVVPVLDPRPALGLQARPPRAGDTLVVVAVGHRRLALRVDRALGFALVDDDVPPPAGLALVLDLEALLPPARALKLDLALRIGSGGAPRTQAPVRGTKLDARRVLAAFAAPALRLGTSLR